MELHEADGATGEERLWQLNASSAECTQTEVGSRGCRRERLLCSQHAQSVQHMRCMIWPHEAQVGTCAITGWRTEGGGKRARKGEKEQNRAGWCR